MTAHRPGVRAAPLPRVLAHEAALPAAAGEAGRHPAAAPPGGRGLRPAAHGVIQLQIQRHRYLTCGIGQRGEESKDTTEERTEASMQSRSGTPSPRATSPSPSPPCHRRGDRETTFSVSRYLWVSPLAINQFSESQ